MRWLRTRYRGWEEYRGRGHKGGKGFTLWTRKRNATDSGLRDNQGFGRGSVRVFPIMASTEEDSQAGVTGEEAATIHSGEWEETYADSGSEKAASAAEALYMGVGYYRARYRTSRNSGVLQGQDTEQVGTRQVRDGSHVAGGPVANVGNGGRPLQHREQSEEGITTDVGKLGKARSDWDADFTKNPAEDLADLIGLYHEGYGKTVRLMAGKA
eukprot:g77990.t1